MLFQKSKNLILAVFALSLLFGCQKKFNYMNIHVVPQTNVIEVDGDPSDWRGLGLQIPLFANTFGETDRQDFFANVKLGWDTENLYLLADVQDDVLFQNENAPAWQNDGFEIFFSRGKGRSEMIQYLGSPALTQAFPLPFVEKQDYRTVSQPEISDLQLESIINENGYTLEIAIPFKSLQVNPAEGDTLALNFYISDSDERGGVKKYSWHYHDNTYQNYDAMHKIVLGKKGINQHLTSRAWLLDTTTYFISLQGNVKIKDSLQLYYQNQVLGKGKLEGDIPPYSFTTSFDKTMISDHTEPLKIMTGEQAIFEINWLDIPRQYVNIQPPNPFEAEILMFEKQDIQNFPPEGATLFIGSSSIRLWKSIPDDFPELETINRGFGGSQTGDVLEMFDRIVAPYRPAKIVFFTGTNDIAAGKLPQEVADNTQEFIERVHALSPETEIYILSNTIAVSRKHLAENYREANRLIHEMINKYDFAEYIDVTNPGLDDNGKPRGEIYRSDSLHLNSKGYEMWTQIVREAIIN